MDAGQDQGGGAGHLGEKDGGVVIEQSRGAVIEQGGGVVIEQGGGVVMEKDGGEVLGPVFVTVIKIGVTNSEVSWGFSLHCSPRSKEVW